MSTCLGKCGGECHNCINDKDRCDLCGTTDMLTRVQSHDYWPKYFCKQCFGKNINSYKCHICGEIAQQIAYFKGLYRNGREIAKSHDFLCNNHKNTKEVARFIEDKHFMRPRTCIIYQMNI